MDSIAADHPVRRNQIKGATISILRVLHAAQQWPALRLKSQLAGFLIV